MDVGIGTDPVNMKMRSAIKVINYSNSDILYFTSEIAAFERKNFSLRSLKFSIHELVSPAIKTYPGIASRTNIRFSS